MELIVFDLDGTLLNRESRISDYTRDTLKRLQQRNIAYTVATGRTLHAARDLLDGCGFDLPQIFKNGVVIWNPQHQAYSHQYLLTESEIQHLLQALMTQGVSPFLFTLEPGQRHRVYHPPLQNPNEQRLAELIGKERNLEVLPLSRVPADADITNISALGPRAALEAVAGLVDTEPGLLAYMGKALEGGDLYWIDIHHSSGNKGGAVSLLKHELGVDRVVCFGDSDNDLPMFELADESYAPENARDYVKGAATAVIGHHDADGIARFLRQRFQL
jgi:Cof subfamily protein (haloacid dehalogenase superfamily)